LVAIDHPEALQAALLPLNGVYVPTNSGHFAAKHTLIRLHRVQMQAVEENLPRIWEATMTPLRHAVSFLAQPGPGVFSRGVEVGFGDVVLHNAAGEAISQRLSGPTRWAAMSLPCEDWQEVAAVMLGRDLTPPLDVPRVASGAALARLRRLHAAAMHLAEHAPEVIANTEAARGLEAELTIALAESLDALPEPTSAIATYHHAAIMRRLRRYLEEHAGQPVYLPELCAAVGTSDRTLRQCCHDYFGLGPKRYLQIRRLRLARWQLQHSALGTTNVTTVATQFGFWELGRFAVDYRHLFGESPSVTLRNALAR
jgi:AraC-like DNA-binding protein